MITKPSRMYRWICELVPDRIHLDKGCHFSCVCVVISKCDTSGGRNCFGFARHKFSFDLLTKPYTDKRVNETREIRPASYTAAHYIRDNIHKLKLLLRFKTYYCLMSKCIIESGGKQVTRVFLM